jgi:hypothetical protein
MSTLSPENKEATKVIAKACHWVDQRKATQSAHAAEKVREGGRLKAIGDELAEAVKKYRMAGGQP